MNDMSCPVEGSEYPVVIGESLFNSESAKPTACFHSLQYNFKPQSAGRSKPGSLRFDRNTVALQVPNSSEGQSNVVFEGQWASSQQGLDCVAIFDGVHWQLELLNGLATNIRHVSGPPVPSTSPLSSPQVRVDASTSDDTLPRSPLVVGLQQAPLEEAMGEKRRSLSSSDVQLPSANPSLIQLSVTPSLNWEPSPDTSPSIQDTQPSTNPHSLRRQKSLERSPPLPIATVGNAANASSDIQPASGSPPVPPPNSMLAPSTSSTSSSSSSDSESEVAQPSHAAPVPLQGKTDEPLGQAGAGVPDFEREFFQDNSDEDSESDESESSGNHSEEEAKHF